MELKVYIDIQGHVGLCEWFPNNEEFGGLNQMLEEDMGQIRNDDTFPEHANTFCIATFKIDQDHGGYDGPGDCYLYIDSLVPVTVD